MPPVRRLRFSALQRAEIAEIDPVRRRHHRPIRVSVLFNEPKLLKSGCAGARPPAHPRFSALQRAEIAEMSAAWILASPPVKSFSALQRAEIAEIYRIVYDRESKDYGFSALQRAEIAEIDLHRPPPPPPPLFQCSSTSRNC